MDRRDLYYRPRVRFSISVVKLAFQMFLDLRPYIVIPVIVCSVQLRLPLKVELFHILPEKCIDQIGINSCHATTAQGLVCRRLGLTVAVVTRTDSLVKHI